MLRIVRPSSAASSFRPQRKCVRSFLSIPGTEATTLTESRILPYQSSSIYALIADVDSYSHFIPYCLESKVTKWSSADSTGSKWPAQADLKVGWGGYEEMFTSKLFCIPESVVEALGGEAMTTLPKASLQHHASTYDIPGTAHQMFKSLSTRWMVKPFLYKPPSGTPQTDPALHPARHQTEVLLTIEFQFANPVYAALSKAVVPKVAGVIIEAFERRARTLLDKPGANLVGKP